jgi:CHASE2 domain-containing sensor protein
MFAVNFIVVFLKGYQTQVIISGTYVAAFVISLMMGAAILTNTMFVIDYGWIGLIPLSLGGAFGIVCSMYIYRKRNKNKSRRKHD